MSEPVSLGQVLAAEQPAVLAAWLRGRAEGGFAQPGPGVAEADASSVLTLLAALAQAREGDVAVEEETAWDDMRIALRRVSLAWAQAGATSAQTAAFVFSLKEALFDAVRRGWPDDPARASRALFSVSSLVDKLGLITVESQHEAMDRAVLRQQRELVELSTPVIAVWHEILVVPLVGTLDSERAQTVTESLLDAIVKHEATVAIIDITGVPMVDTLVAHHILKTIAAAAFMGTRCIVSGIRPQIAQTIVNLGIDLGQVATTATLADALRIAFAQTGVGVRAAKGR